MKYKDKIGLITVTIIGIVMLVFGITYATWQINKVQERDNNVSTSCFDIEFVGYNDIDLKKAYPILDSEGIVLEPYTFTITNTCDLFASYHVNLEELKGDNMINNNYIKVAINTNYHMYSEYVSAPPSLNDASSAIVLLKGGLASGESNTYSLRLWIDENAPDSEMNKNFKSKVVVTAVPENQLLITALLNSNNVININPDFSKISSENDSGFYYGTGSLADEYGDIYYFRGNKSILNNNVVFAGYQWKIVRINGDSTIRLIYNGVCPNNSCNINTSGTNTHLKYSKYNISANSNAYVGYMYGDFLGEKYNDVHTNSNDSNLKMDLDAWYEENIYNTKYHNKIADNMFCGNRSLYSGTGIGNVETYYDTYNRLVYKSNINMKCQNITGDVPTTNDQYTVDKTDKIGNGDLTYPVGLITIDEVILIGNVYGTKNPDNFIYTGISQWLFTPAKYTPSNHAANFVLTTSHSPAMGIVDASYGIRPVISLKSDVRILTGDGSAINPYIVK